MKIEFAMHRFQKKRSEEGWSLTKILIKCWFDVNPKFFKFVLFLTFPKMYPQKKLFSLLQGIQPHSQQTG